MTPITARPRLDPGTFGVVGEGVALDPVSSGIGGDAPAQEVAARLGVRYVIEGSLRRAGDRLLINAVLIDGATGRQVWGEQHEADAAGLPLAQRDIVTRIVGTLFSGVRETERAAALRRPPRNLDVYEMTLQGITQKHRSTREGLVAARDVLTRAVELDPGYAPAILSLGYTDAVDIGLRQRDGRLSNFRAGPGDHQDPQGDRSRADTPDGA